jgi:hypothetical protein
MARPEDAPSDIEAENMVQLVARRMFGKRNIVHAMNQLAMCVT